MATATTTGSGPAEVYFFTSSHTSIGNLALKLPSDFILSMSADGSIVAVGGGLAQEADSLTLVGVQTVPTSMPVGGFDVAPNYLVVFLKLAGPWITVAVASAVAIAVFLKKARRHGDDAEA
jgi:hypothetical protein